MKILAYLGGGILAGLAAPASATILTFDVSGGVSDHAAIAQSYGDRATASPDGVGHSYSFGAEGATANVVVDYGAAGEDPSLWMTGYGNLTNIYFNDADGDTTLTIGFTADAGYLVNLYGFDIASFVNAGQTIQGLAIRDLGTNSVLYSQGIIAVSGTTRNSFNWNTPLTASRLQIVIDLTGLGGASDDIGLDNIRFGQAAAPLPGVPEPAAWAMMIAGFGLIGTKMRRRATNVKVTFA